MAHCSSKLSKIYSYVLPTLFTIILQLSKKYIQYC